MLEIKTIQFIGVSPIILGESRAILTPRARGITEIKFSDNGDLEIHTSTNELYIVPQSAIIVNYKQASVEAHKKVDGMVANATATISQTGIPAKKKT